MRRRTFTPEAPGGLEDRVVLSGASGPHPGAVVVSGLRFNMALDLVRRDFELFATGGDFDRLRAMLAQHTADLPFHRDAALGPQINAILARMQSDLASGTPGAIATAHRGVVAAIRADTQARIDAGTLVVGP